MGIYKVDECVFTGLPVKNLVDADMRDAIEYLLEIEGRQTLIRLPHEAVNWGDSNDFFKKNRHIFESLLLNNDWFDDTKTLITIDRLNKLLGQKRFPKSPQEKADLLFFELLKLQHEDGEYVRLMQKISFKKLFFKSENEFYYYMEYFIKKGLIEGTIDKFIGGRKSLSSFTITFDGLNYGIQLEAEGAKSNLCFIAMSFKAETGNIRNAIKEALWETGFQPILIDEQNIDSDKTINDEIIANLKKCRFCIADFSYHSNGVYFESGFALGQGKKVIYTCLKSEFEKAHFDIRPLQHIIYENAEQLKIDLKHKIEAWVI